MDYSDDVELLEVILPADAVRQIRGYLLRRMNSYQKRIGSTRDDYIRRAQRAGIHDADELFPDIPGGPSADVAAVDSILKGLPQ